MTAYGAAILLGVALARALTRVSVARARAAGFEMLWLSEHPLRRATKGKSFILKTELRNRDTLPTRFRDLSVSHAPALDIKVVPLEGEVPARGSLLLTLHITPRQVGYQGIHNVTLQTVRAPGLYTIPLSFSNPYVVEVLPAPVSLRLPSTSAGGRAMKNLANTLRGTRNGDGAELREIREHRPGDPYRRIAWKASARRGRLLIVEKEEEQADTVWVLIEASMEAASGPPGNTALDGAIDRAMAAIESHLARGDRVGLAIVGTRILSRIQPGHGPGHRARLITALSLCTHCADADRSDWDESDVVRKVLEHAASLDARAAAIQSYEHEKLFHLVSELLSRTPVRAEAPWATGRLDRLLRQYLLSFGIQPPPRGSSDRHRVQSRLAKELIGLASTRKRPSRVTIYADPPSYDTPPAFLKAMGALVRARIDVHFVPTIESVALSDESPDQDALKRKIVLDALHFRQRLATNEGLRRLLTLGVKITRLGRKLDLKRKVDFFAGQERSEASQIRSKTAKTQLI